MQIKIDYIGKIVSENFPNVDTNQMRKLMLMWGLQNHCLEDLQVKVYFSSEMASPCGLIWPTGESFHILLPRESVRKPDINQIAIHELRHLYWFLYQWKVLCRDRRRCDFGSQDDCYEAEERYSNFSIVCNFQLSFPFPKR